MTWRCDVCRDERTFLSRKGLQAHLFHFHQLTLQQNRNQAGEVFDSLEQLVGMQYEIRKRHIQMAAASKSERTLIRRRTEHIVRPQRHSHIRVQEGDESTSSATVARTSTESSPTNDPSLIENIHVKSQTWYPKVVPLDSAGQKENWEDELDYIPIEALVELFPGEDNEMLLEQYRVPTPEVDEQEPYIGNVILKPPMILRMT